MALPNWVSSHLCIPQLIGAFHMGDFTLRSAQMRKPKDGVSGNSHGPESVSAWRAGRPASQFLPNGGTIARPVFTMSLKVVVRPVSLIIQ